VHKSVVSSPTDKLNLMGSDLLARLVPGEINRTPFFCNTYQRNDNGKAG